MNEKLLDSLTDDKSMVIFAVWTLGMTGLFVLDPPDAVSILTNIITGLFGIAVGRVMK